MWKLSQYYQAIAMLFLNLCMIFFLLNMVFFTYFKLQPERSRPVDPVSEKYGDRLKQIYPGMSRDDIAVLLHESWSRPFAYEPFTEYKERPFKGRFINVDANGFRVSKDQGPWPPDRHKYFTVFLFGGSTTFSYGLADKQTMASYLQELLTAATRATKNKDARVYNFGRGSYYSTQERILFERFLSRSIVPDMAIFIDGITDFYFSQDEPLFSDVFKSLTEEYLVGKPVDSGPGSRVVELLNELPLIRAFNGLHDRFARRSPSVNVGPGAPGSQQNTVNYADENTIDGVIRRYLMNREIIRVVSRAFAVKSVFVWQPSPLYGYEQRYNLFGSEEFGAHTYEKFGYPRMAKFVTRNSMGEDFLWCADIQRNEQEALYVDKVHYSAKLSRKLAKCVFDQIETRHLLTGRY